MGGKRKPQPSGNAQGKAAANQDAATAQGGASRKRQTRGLSVFGDAGSAEAGSRGQEEESGSILAPVAMCFSIRCDPRALAGRKAALEAALRKVVANFGGWGCRVEWARVGPSEDTLQRVLPLVLGRVDPECAVNIFKTCKSWRRELAARGYCSKTVQLCAALAQGGDAGRLGQSAMRRLNASSGEVERAMCLDATAFLQSSGGREGCLHEWLQAASQEPDTSFLSRGAASTAAALGLRLVHWVGKPQGSFPGSYTLRGHAGVLRSVAFSPDGKRVVSGSKDYLVKIWNSETGAEVHTLTGHSNIVLAVAFSPDGKRVVSGADDKCVKIWNADTGAEVRTLTGHFSGVWSVSFSPDGKRIVSGSYDKLVKIWNARTGAEMHTLTGHSGGVYSISFSPNGKRVVSGSSDNLVKIWDVESGAEVCTLTGHSGGVNSVAFSPDGQHVVSGSSDNLLSGHSDNLVKIWDAKTGAEVRTLAGHSDAVHRVQFSDDGAQVVSDSRDNTVRFWDVASGRQVRQLKGHRFAFVEGPSGEHPSGEHTRARHVLTASGDTLLVYAGAKEDGADGAPVACFKAPKPINSVRCFGAAICVGCVGGAVCILSAPFLVA